MAFIGFDESLKFNIINMKTIAIINLVMNFFVIAYLLMIKFNIKFEFEYKKTFFCEDKIAIICWLYKNYQDGYYGKSFFIIPIVRKQKREWLEKTDFDRSINFKRNQKPS